MAWTATFLANFEQFDAALRAAEPKLGAFDQNVKKVQRSLQTMTSEFDGTKITQQATTMATAIEKAGGAAKLTDAELKKANATLQEALEKYRKLGQDAPASLQSMADAVRKQITPLEQATQKTTAWGGALTSIKGIAAGFVAGFTLDRVIGGITNAVGSTIAWGGAITDLSAKTGVSMTALQKWEYAAKQSGNTLDQVVTASLQLSKRIEEGDKAVEEAITGLGLNMAQLRSLQPEQQFDAVAEALAKTSDQGHRASSAMALFGRAGADLLPTLTADMKALGDEAERLGVIVDEQTLVAMDELGDAWQKMKDAGRGLLAEVMAPLIPQMNTLASAASNAAKAFRDDFWPSLLRMSAVGAGGPFGLGAQFMQQFGGGGAAAQTPSRPGVPVVTTSEFFGSQRGLAGEDVVAGVFMRDLVPAARESAAALRQVAQASAVLRDVNIFNATRNGGVSVFQSLPFVSPSLLQNAAVLGGQANPWGGIAQITPAMGYTPGAPLGVGGASWAPNYRSLGAGLPGVVTGAIQGGGSIAGSIGSYLGGGMLTGVGNRVTESVSKSLGDGMLGNMLGGVLGSAIPLVGSLLGGLVGKLFGPSQGAILGREADARIGQTQAGLLQQYGSLDAIAAMGSAGADLVAGWGHKNVTGERAFNELVAAFERQNQLLGEQKGLQSEIAGIEAQRAAIEDGLKTTWEQVVAISERYGISLEGLGGQVAQLGATTTWTTMLNDLEALVRAGADMGGILVGMQDEISALVQESLRLGTEIPENMRPYIEELQRSGRLVDANGEALTDLSGLRWGPAVQTQADIAREAMERLDKALTKLTDRLAEIVDLLANKLPAAAEQGARGAGGAVSGIEPGIRVEESFAGGSHGVQDFGTGTLAMLHGREAVLTEAQLQRVAGGAGMTIQPAQVVLDRRVVGEILFELLPGVAARRGLVPGMAY